MVILGGWVFLMSEVPMYGILISALGVYMLSMRLVRSPNSLRIWEGTLSEDSDDLWS